MFEKKSVFLTGVKHTEFLRVGIFFFLLLLLVVLGDGKQAVVSVVAAAGVLCMFLADRVLSVSGYILRKKQIVLWGTILLFLLISSVFSISPGFSVSEGAKYVFGFLVFVYFSRPSPGLTSERFGSALAQWVLLIVGISFFVTTFSGLQQLLPNMNLLYKAYGHNHITGLLMFVVPFVLERYRKKRNVASVLAAACIGAALLYSFSRGALMLVSVYAAYYVIARTRSRSPALKGAIICLIAVIFAAGFYLFSYSIRITSYVPQFETPVRKESLSESRTHYWKQAWIAFSQKPLTGWGLGSFYLLSKRFEDRPSSFSWYAHSFPAQVLAELGVFPFIMLSLLLSMILFPIFRIHVAEKKETEYYFALAEGTALALLYSFVEINMDFMVVWLLFWAMLGYLSYRFSTGGSASRQLVKSSILVCGTITALYYTALLSSYTLWLTPYHLYAFAAAPFVADNALAYISGSKQPLRRVERQIIVAFHGANPEIMYVLAENVKQVSPSESAAYLHSAVTADPFNSQYALAFIRLLFDRPELATERELSDIAAPIYNATRENVLNQGDPQIAALVGRGGIYQDMFIKSVRQVLTGGRDYFYTKLYYVWGENLQTIDKDASAALLAYASHLSPQWSYFHLELASFYAHAKKDPVAAKRALSACGFYSDARGHCEEFVVDTLPVPGSFFTEIINMR